MNYNQDDKFEYDDGERRGRPLKANYGGGGGDLLLIWVVVADIGGDDGGAGSGAGSGSGGRFGDFTC